MSYSKSPFHLPDDLLVTRHMRRCVKPKFDDGKEKYTLASLRDLATDGNNSVRIPVHTRYVSPLCNGYRSPNLPESYWAFEEDIQQARWTQCGARIQIYSIINTVNIKTVYYIERTLLPSHPWRRIIITFHLSEERMCYPHTVDEFDMK